MNSVILVAVLGLQCPADYSDASTPVSAVQDVTVDTDVRASAVHQASGEVHHRHACTTCSQSYSRHIWYRVWGLYERLRRARDSYYRDVYLSRLERIHSCHH